MPYLLVLGMLMLSQPKQSNALGGAYQSHDPSTIIKEGSKYWMFTTGNGIYAVYSKNSITGHPAQKQYFPLVHGLRAGAAKSRNIYDTGDER